MLSFQFMFEEMAGPTRQMRKMAVCPQRVVAPPTLGLFCVGRGQPQVAVGAGLLLVDFVVVILILVVIVISEIVLETKDGVNKSYSHRYDI